MSDDYIPTPQQIKDECKKIQSEWSEDVELKRRATKYFEYTIPKISVELEDCDKNVNWENDD